MRTTAAHKEDTRWVGGSSSSSSRMIEVDDPVWGLMVGLRMAQDASGEDSGYRCPFCATAEQTTLVDGNETCRACNSIVGRFLDHGAEWRFYASDDARGPDPTRCCPPSSELLPTLGCVVSGGFGGGGYGIGGGGGASGSGTGTGASGDGPSASRLVQRYQIWNSLSYRQRTLCGVFDLLAVNASQNGIPSCILEEAKSMYKRVSDAKITRGENRHALIASCLYMACKSSKVPRSLKEVAAMFDVRVNAMTKSCRLFQQTIRMELSSSAPQDFVGRFCSKLGMSDEVTAMSRRVLERADQMAIVCESTPPAVVAGVIQLVCSELGLAVDKQALADVCHVSPVTITKCYKRLATYRDHLLLDGDQQGRECEDDQKDV